MGGDRRITAKSDGLRISAFAWVLIGLLGAAGLIAMDLAAAASRPGLLVNSQAILGRDFANLWSGGRMTLTGELAILYDLDAYEAWQRAHLDPGMSEYNYSYPPVSLLYAWAFGALPYLPAMLLWQALSIGSFSLAARPWLRDMGLGGAWGLFLPISWIGVWVGQYSLIFAALWLVAWRELDRRPTLAGLATGAMIFKPHLALLMPFLLAYRGAWRAFWVAAATVVAIVALSVILFGTELWRTYFTATSGVQTDFLWKTPFFFSGVVSNAYALGLPRDLSIVLHAAAAIAAMVLLFWKMPRSNAQLAMLAATATFIILPYALYYDAVIPCLAGFFLLHQGTVQRKPQLQLVGGLATLFGPAVIILSAFGILFAPIVILALFVGQLFWPQPRPMALR